jgi:hypothetical protein
LYTATVIQKTMVYLANGYNAQQNVKPEGERRVVPYHIDPIPANCPEMGKEERLDQASGS